MTQPSTEFDHVAQSVRPAFDLSDGERIKRISSPIWYPYAKADQIIESLTLLATGEQCELVMIHGPAANGKKRLIERYMKPFPAQVDDLTGNTSIPIRMTTVLGIPTVANLLETILGEMSIGRVRSSKDENTLGKRLSKQGTKVLVLSRASNLLNSQQCRELLAVLRNLHDNHGISIILLSTTDAIGGLNKNSEFSRSTRTEALPKWIYDESYFVLLEKIGRSLPLRKPSQVFDVRGRYGKFDQAAALKILNASQGALGSLLGIIRTAATQAIASGDECIK
jgi:Bacterial TniB protein